jgi:MarR family transcriptional regulator, organic hydroperoxide resistance regulator
MKKANMQLVGSGRVLPDRAHQEKDAAEASTFMDHDLEKAVPYLLARAGMRMGQAFSKELKRFGLSLTEWRVCAALHHKPHQRLAELATHTSAEPSTLSRTVEGMLQRGLLIRDRSGADARALAISLTPEGDALAERIIPLAQLYDRVALAGISAAQADLLRDMLGRIYSNMENLDPGG